MGGRAEDAVNGDGGGRGPVVSLVLLAAALAVGAYLRFDRLGEPSYWLDEILHQHQTTFAAAKPWWQWFGRLHEENAGLYYLSQLVTRIFGRSELAGRSTAALFGLATIPVVWLGVRQLRLPGAYAAAAAILLATSPLHVYYSREARGYALLMLLTAALIVILLRGRSLGAMCAVLLALLYTSAVAPPMVAAAAIVSLILAIASRERETRRWYAAAGACAIVTLGLFRVLYGPGPLPVPGLPHPPPLDLTFFTSIARMFSVSALGAAIGGRAAVAMAVFAIVGAMVSFRRDWRDALVLTGMTVLPFAISLAALRVFDHFFSVRYVVVSLIGYVMLAGIGIATLARVTGRYASTALTVAIVVIIAAQGWSSARTEAFRKLDWRGIAASLRKQVRPGDVILAAEPWSEVSLRYYLGEIPNVQLVHMAGVGIAEIMTNGSPAAWLVTAGASGDTSVRTWMCRYPVVASSTLESFRLHYAPSIQDFHRTRTGPPEQRAVSAALGDRGFTLRMGPNVDFAFADGWAGAEGSGDDTFRWAVGHRATLVFPRPARRDRVIRFRAYPAAPQTARMSLNGRTIGAIALAPEWRDYSLDVPAALWNDGVNTLTFDFEKTVVPSSRDPRELAASFQSISIDDRGYTSTPVRVVSIRLDADRFIDASTAWRNTATRFPAAHLHRAAVEALLGRLGYDPVAGWQKLARNEIHLDDVVESIAAGSDCEDDSAFLDRAFAILLERAPNGIERSDLLRRLHEGATREHVIDRIVKSDDFRKRV
jgi:mannosyltransferase